MPNLNSEHLQFSTLITKSRLYRRALLDDLNEKIKSDEQKHQKVQATDWEAAGKIERQCEMIKQTLTYFESKL